MDLKLKEKYGKLEDYILKNPNSYKDSITRKKGDTKKALSLPTYDSVFKWMFATEEAKKNACLLLSTILDIDVNRWKKDMVLIRNELGRDRYGGKNAILDFVGKVDDVIFDVEMNQTNKLERNIDYANRLYAINYTEWKDSYNCVFQMNINNFRIKGIEEAIKINVLGEKGLRSKIIIVDVYLPILNEKYRKKQDISAEERIILWMFIGNEEKMKEIGGEDENMKEYLKRLKTYTDEEKRVSEYDLECDSAIAGLERGLEEGLEKGIKKGRKEGLKAGREEGREENRIETATTMLKDGLSKEIVQKYTKLPLEKIVSLMSLL